MISGAVRADAAPVEFVIDSDSSNQSIEHLSGSLDESQDTVDMCPRSSQKSLVLKEAVQHEQDIQLKKFKDNNLFVASDPLQHGNITSNQEKGRFEKLLDRCIAANQLDLDELQRHFLERSWYSKSFLNLDGFPGSGKTFLLCLAAKLLSTKNSAKVALLGSNSSTF